MRRGRNEGPGNPVDGNPRIEPGTRALIDRRRFLLSATAAGSGAALWPLHQQVRAPISLNSVLTAATAPVVTMTRGAVPDSSTSPGQVVVPPPTGDPGTDTANALSALDAPAGTTVIFQASSSAVYSIDRELPVPPGVRVTGYGAPCEQPQTGLMATLQQAPGAALHCIMASASYLAGLYSGAQYNDGVPQTAPDTAIEVDHLVFDGNNGGSSGVGNTVGHGLVVFSTGSSVHDCYFLNVAQAALVVSDCNYAGTPCTQGAVGNRVFDNKVMNCGTYGIWVMNTAGSAGALDGFAFYNVIESPSLQTVFFNTPTNPATGVPYEAIRLDMAAGWWVVNNHAYACPGNGMFFGTPLGLHFINNSTDSFGCNPQPGKTYTGYAFSFVGTAGDFRPAMINTNQLSAYEGYNTDTPYAAGASNTYRYYYVYMDQADPNGTAWLEQSSNSAHQDSQAPTPIYPAVLTMGSTQISVPNGAAQQIQPGMTIGDSGGYLPSGTTVSSVTPGSGGASDVITVSMAATGSAGNDTISFVGPATVGWTYVNALSGSTLVVNRTNEVITGTVVSDPVLSGAGAVKIIDPAQYVGGIPVVGIPAPSQVLVATSATAAGWETLSSDAPERRVTVMASSGTYSVPAGVSQLRITCVGGGGGGGGGGSAGTHAAQAGGSGGAAGSCSSQILSVRPGDSLVITVGSGGAGGQGGAAGGSNPGQNGVEGGPSMVAASAGLVIGNGGPGGKGPQGGSNNFVNGAAYGGQPDSFTSGTTGGCGGSSGAAGGAPIDYSAGGGGGGGSSTSTAGGSAGGAGTATSGGGAGASGGRSSTTGASGTAASATGAGGGGGGGGTAGSAGGAGGSGASGMVIIEITG